MVPPLMLPHRVAKALDASGGSVVLPACASCGKRHMAHVRLKMYKPPKSINMTVKSEMTQMCLQMVPPPFMKAMMVFMVLLKFLIVLMCLVMTLYSSHLMLKMSLSWTILSMHQFTMLVVSMVPIAFLNMTLIMLLLTLTATLSGPQGSASIN